MLSISSLSKKKKVVLVHAAEFNFLFQCNGNHITNTFGNYKVCLRAMTDILFHVFVGLWASPEEIWKSGEEASQAHNTMIQHTQCL